MLPCRFVILPRCRDGIASRLSLLGGDVLGVIQDGALWDEVLSWAGMLSETGCYQRRDAIPSLRAVVRVEAVGGPGFGIVVDVALYLVEGGGGAYDVVVEAGLPFKWDMRGVAFSGYGSFKGSDYLGKPHGFIADG